MLGHHWKWLWLSVSFYGVFNLGKRSRVSFLDSSSMLWVDGGAAGEPVLVAATGAVPSQSLSCCTQHSLTCHTLAICDSTITNLSLWRTKLFRSTRAAKNASERKCLKNSNVQLGLWNSSLGWPQIQFVFSQDPGHFTQSWPLGVNIAEQGYTTWIMCVVIKCLLMSNRNYPGYSKLLPWKDINIAQQVAWVFCWLFFFLLLYLFIIFQN